MKIRYLRTLLALCLITACIGACSSTSKQSKPNPNQLSPEKQDKAVNAMLAEAAASVSDSLVTLSKTEQAAQPVIAQPSPSPETYGMGMTTSTDWSGPIGPFVNQIASIANYTVKVSGTSPSIPIIVTVVARNKKLGDILSDAAYQCGSRADVVVYPDTQTIELRYREQQ